MCQGSAQIKMAPPQSTKYLYPNYDYDNFEFKSPVNPWKVQPNYSADFDKIKCLEFTLTPGKTLFIPAYWWYSIKFNKNTSISCFFYRTYMNNIAVSPYIGMHALQIQNVKRESVKKINIQELNKPAMMTSQPDANDVQGPVIIPLATGTGTGTGSSSSSSSSTTTSLADLPLPLPDAANPNSLITVVGAEL